jgi:hypothetical protein
MPLGGRRGALAPRDLERGLRKVQDETANDISHHIRMDYRSCRSGADRREINRLCRKVRRVHLYDNSYCRPLRRSGMLLRTSWGTNPIGGAHHLGGRIDCVVASGRGQILRLWRENNVFRWTKKSEYGETCLANAIMSILWILASRHHGRLPRACNLLRSVWCTRASRGR